MTGGAVTLVVPASSANLGPGFDALGLALGIYDEVTVEIRDQQGLSVHVDGVGADVLPGDESHLVVRALRAGFDRFGGTPSGLAVSCVNRIPQGRGLGSSAAAIVAGVLAAAGIAAGGDVGEEGLAQVLDVASRLEGHPDNVAACLFGGFTVAWSDDQGARAARLDPAAGLHAVLFVPAAGLPTETARGMLPSTVPHQDARHAAGRSALLVAALTRRTDLLLPATEDRLHQPYRAAAMKPTADLVARLRAGGLAAVVSGAGPSVLVLLSADAQEAAAQSELAGPEWTVLAVPVDRAGAQISAPLLT